MNISAAVQAHPSRALQAAALAAQIGAEVVFDPDPDHEVKSPWRTFRRLLETTPVDATHRFQIQDDAIVCPDFRDALELAVASRPDRLLVFFVGSEPKLHSNAVMKACDRDEAWAELAHAHWCPVVATCWPVWMIAPLLEFVDEQGWRDSFFADDERVGRFVRAINHRPLASVPSLVEHPETTPSLVGKRTGRHAACWIGSCEECSDASQIDWSRGPGA